MKMLYQSGDYDVYSNWKHPDEWKGNDIRYVNTVPDIARAQRYNKDFKVDYFFTFNHSISKIYSKYIKAKFIEIGSYRNNLLVRTIMRFIYNRIYFLIFRYHVRQRNEIKFNGVHSVFQFFSSSLKLKFYAFNFLRHIVIS